jgi:dienelactone hydrolase
MPFPARPLSASAGPARILSATRLVCLILATSPVLRPIDAGAAEPIPHAHQRLDYYVDARGHEQPLRTVDDWRHRRESILAGMQAVMGPLPAEMRRGTPDSPEPAPLDVKMIETTEQEGVPRQTISIASRNGERVTAYVWWPPRTAIERHAAILALHPTGDIGKGICAGYGKENRGYGIELARRGYVVIAPDYVSFGDQKNHDFAQDDYESGTMKGIVDHMRCVDYLQSRDDVDPERIGVIGHSLGGHNSLFVAAFDPRIKAIVSSCGWNAFHHYYGGKKLANWAQQRYMPRVVSTYAADPDKMPFDFYEVAAAMAPRPFFTNSPLEDSNFEFAGVKKAIRAARPIYALHNAADALQARYPNCAHDFPDQQRREAYAFLDTALDHKPTARIPEAKFGKRTLVEIKSTADGSMQPTYVSVPEGYDPQAAPVPLLVNVHSWSGDLTQRAVETEVAAGTRGWIFLAPNFRGSNDKPEACGSKLAQQDVLDAVEWAATNYRVDRKRIYLVGSSGGGHMTMLLAGTHPEVWAAASAWVGISDLAAWHRLHANDRYGAALRKCCGGPPGAGAVVDEEYRLRSPLTHLAGAKNLPLEIAAGIYDGHLGSVPVKHSLDAFNVVAKANGDAGIDEATIARLGSVDWPAAAPAVESEVADPTYDRTIYFRQTSSKCRVTLFEGGHERLESAAVAWLAQFSKE